MKGNNARERIHVTDAGDDVIVSFVDSGDMGTIYLTPKKVRKLIAKLQAVVEAEDGDSVILDDDGDRWILQSDGKYTSPDNVHLSPRAFSRLLVYGPLTRA